MKMQKKIEKGEKERFNVLFRLFMSNILLWI